jgi:hypothetical protein
MLTVGLGLAGWSLWSLSTCTKTTGTVHKTGPVVNKTTGKWRGAQGYRVSYSAADGTAHNFDTSTLGWLGFNFDEGEKVDVLYDPSTPSNAYRPTFVNLWLLPILFIAIGILPLLGLLRRGEEEEGDLSADELIRRSEEGSSSRRNR